MSVALAWCRRRLIGFAVTFDARNVISRAGIRAGSRLAGERRQFARRIDIDAETLRDARAIIFVGLQEVPNHALLNAHVGFLEIRDEIVDEIVAMTVIERAVDLAGLLVVVAGAIL